MKIIVKPRDGNFSKDFEMSMKYLKTLELGGSNERTKPAREVQHNAVLMYSKGFFLHFHRNFWGLTSKAISLTTTVLRKN